MAQLTDRLIKSLKPRQTSYYQRDNTGRRGEGRLVVKVQPKGSKAFYFQYYTEGKVKYIPLGSYPALGLADARSIAAKHGQLLVDGIDPKTHLEAKRHREEVEAAELERKAREEQLKGSVQDLFRAYTDNMISTGKRTAPQVMTALEKDALPVLGNATKAKEVTAGDIKLVLAKMIQRGAVVQSNRVRSYLCAAFNYGIKHDNDPANMNRDTLFGIDHNPVMAVPRQDVEKTGERDLSADEIRRFWLDLPRGGFSLELQILYRLCFATGGQRPNELLVAEWVDIDFDRCLWEMPPSKTKNKRAHVVPLNDLAMELLASLRAITGAGRYLFPKKKMDPSEEEKPMPSASVSRALARYCKGYHLKGEQASQANYFESFVPRDIRRTVKTRMGELGISKELRDRIANHAINDVSAKHYDRYDYVKEKRGALEEWGEWLLVLTGRGE
jgi:integrase